MKLARIVLRLSAVPFAVVGVAFLIRPEDMASWVGVSLGSATADADVRAVYGGLQLGCAALLFGAAANRDWVRAGVHAQLALYGGLAAARFLSMAIVGLPSPFGIALHAGELVGLFCGALAWWTLRDAHEP